MYSVPNKLPAVALTRLSSLPTVCSGMIIDVRVKTKVDSFRKKSRRRLWLVLLYLLNECVWLGGLGCSAWVWNVTGSYPGFDSDVTVGPLSKMSLTPNCTWDFLTLHPP